METEPDVSVVIPVWGDYAGPALTEALASLRSQSLPARILLVDNACDPPLDPALADELIRSERRLSVGAARNLGLEAVRTPLVMFWDADDVMLPDTLETLRARIAAAPDAVLVAAAIYEGDPPVRHRWPRPWTARLAGWPRAFALADSVWSLFPTTGSTLIRTAAAAATGFGDANSGEDWVLGISLALRGRILFDPHPGRLYKRDQVGLWEQQRSRAQLAKNARAIRERLRADPAAPLWLRGFIPAIALLQGLATHLVQPLIRTLRAIRPMRRSAQ